MQLENRHSKISHQAALELIGRCVAPLPAAALPLQTALGCTLAKDVVAGMAQPPFPRSPYDGYALRAADTQSAGEAAPVCLEVTGESTAGHPLPAALAPGRAARIMTGGVIPSGADCVVPQEAVEARDGRITLRAPLRAGDNYCPMGEDFETGTLLAAAGTPVSAVVAAVAASAGHTRLSCIPRARCAVLSTGDELQSPGRPLVEGQIYDANSVLIQARLAELGLPVTHTGHTIDDLDALCAALESGVAEADLLITTGGVSVGARDLVPAALERLDAEVLFHGVDMKPGMPTLVALAGGKPVVALSGNPFAAAVGFELLARRALAALTQNPAMAPAATTARLAEDYTKTGNFTRFLRGSLRDGAVHLPGGQGNGQLRSMIGCNCLAEIPAGGAGLRAGDTVRVHLL